MISVTRFYITVSALGLGFMWRRLESKWGVHKGLGGEAQLLLGRVALGCDWTWVCDWMFEIEWTETMEKARRAVPRSTNQRSVFDNYPRT